MNAEVLNLPAMGSTKIVELIVTTDRRGDGEKGDPIRLITQLYTKDGLLVAEEHDKYLEE